MRIEDEITQWGERFYNKIRTMDLTPIYPQIIAVVRRSVVANFQSGGRYGSDVWGGGSAAWKPSGRAIKKGGKTLRNKGLLLNSIQVIIERKGSGNGFNIKLSTNLPYAAIHQYGGQIKQGARSESFKRARYKAGSKKGKFKKATAKQKATQTVQQGMTFGARTITIPARPYLVLQRADVDAITALLKRFYVANVK